MLDGIVPRLPDHGLGISIGRLARSHRGGSGLRAERQRRPRLATGANKCAAGRQSQGAPAGAREARAKPDLDDRQARTTIPLGRDWRGPSDEEGLGAPRCWEVPS